MPCSHVRRNAFAGGALYAGNGWPGGLGLVSAFEKAVCLHVLSQLMVGGPPLPLPMIRMVCHAVSQPMLVDRFAFLGMLTLVQRSGPKPVFTPQAGESRAGGSVSHASAYALRCARHSLR